MTLDAWIRAQKGARQQGAGGSAASREGRMTDIEFAVLLADPENGIPSVSQQAVSLWRRGLRSPNDTYMQRIFNVTNGAVTRRDFDGFKANA